MPKVRFLVNTAYQGPRHEGEVIDVPDDFASRWVKNGIAELANDAPAVDPDPVPAGDDDNGEQNGNTDANDYSNMSAKELYTLCKEKGIEVEAKKGKEYYLEKLA